VAFDGCSTVASNSAFQTVVIALGVNVTTAVGVVEAKLTSVPVACTDALVKAVALALAEVGAVPVIPIPMLSETAAEVWSKSKAQWALITTALLTGSVVLNPVTRVRVVLVESVKSDATVRRTGTG
jgi:hypothetical protein